MHVTQRNLLLVGLAATSGSLDCWSYFGLAHTFIANMTGNTVLLGFALANAQWTEAAGTGAAVLGYCGGVFIGALLARPVRRAVQSHLNETAAHTVLWPRRLTALLGLELLLLLIAVLAEVVHTPVENRFLAHALVCLCAVAVGMQSAAITALQVQGVATTYITGTWTTMATGLAHFVHRKRSKPGEENHHVRLHAFVLTSYLAAAASAGFCLRTEGRTFIGMLPVALLLCVIAGGLAWGDAASEPPSTLG